MDYHPPGKILRTRHLYGWLYEGGSHFLSFGISLRKEGERALYLPYLSVLYPATWYVECPKCFGIFSWISRWFFSIYRLHIWFFRIRRLHKWFFKIPQQLCEISSGNLNFLLRESLGKDNFEVLRFLLSTYSTNCTRLKFICLYSFLGTQTTENNTGVV